MNWIIKHTPPSRHALQRGTTLVEIMVALVILTVGVISFLGAFGGISKSIHFSRTRSIANNLSQEQIESLKNISYYRLLVTTSVITAPEPGLGAFPYDSGYYPSETMEVGGVSFQRRVLVQKVTETTGVLVANNWYDNDTGLKLVTSYVVWREGSNWKMTKKTNLRDNANRQPMDSNFTGTVTSGGSPLQDASVIIQQNVLLKDTSDALGSYTIQISSGSYDLKASKRGYFPLTKHDSVGKEDSTTVLFPMVRMASGTVNGKIYVNTHLVLSEMCAAVNGDDNIEYIELYNPTSSTFTFEQGGSNPTYLIQYVRTAGLLTTDINPVGQTIYVNTTIYPYSYFLIASTPVVNNGVSAVTADAYYSDLFLTVNVPDNRVPINISGGVRVVSRGVYEPINTMVDAVGWGNVGPPYGPSISIEGNGINMVGPLPSAQLERRATRLSQDVDMQMQPVAGPHATWGNAFDSNDNNEDWTGNLTNNNAIPQNSSTHETPRSGTPARNAMVFIDDGLSASAFAVSGSEANRFSVGSVATGTWNAVISSAGYMAEYNGITITPLATVDIGTVVVTAPAAVGFVAGRVVNSGGSGLNNIYVTASSGYDYSDSNGYYRFFLDAGTFTVTANPNNNSASYTLSETTGVVIHAGQQTTITPMTLYSGGGLHGFVSTNGTDELPGIPVVATSVASGAEVGSYVSDSMGKYHFKNLAVGDYTIRPILEVGESASPVVKTITVISGGDVDAGTFTVTNAFGRIEGQVTAGGQPITTGVLIAAVPTGTTIGANPPPINNALRNGAVYYYFASCGSDGSYSLAVRRGTIYNVYAWYTTFNGNTPNPSQKIDTANLTVNGTATVNFPW